MAMAAGEIPALPIILIFNILMAIFHCLCTQGLTMRQIRFRFDGQPVNETDTPSQVRLHLFFSLHMNTAESLLYHQ